MEQGENIIFEKTNIMKKTILFSLVISIFFTSCIAAIMKKDTLTEEKVGNYIEVYEKLREEAPDILENINKDPENADIGKEEYDKFLKIIKKGGFESFADFVYTNAKIGSVFSLIQAEKGMDNFENMNESGNDMFDESIAEIQKIIDDSQTPEETRKELIQQITDIKENQKLMNDSYVDNEEIAEFVMKSVKTISGLIVSEEDIRIITKFEAEIMHAYVGFQLPELPDGKFPEMNFDEFE